MNPFAVRPASVADAAELLAIYRPFVERTSVSFEYEAPTVAEFAARIEKAQLRHAWLCATAHGRAIGFAYAGPHRERAAYRWSTETSAYVAPEWHRRGVARVLYERLFEALIERGYCNALAGITLPNPASVAFHARLGFTPAGVYRRVGFKFGAWHDVAWYERWLADGPRPPLTP